MNALTLTAQTLASALLGASVAAYLIGEPLVGVMFTSAAAWAFVVAVLLGSLAYLGEMEDARVIADDDHDEEVSLR